MPIDEVENLFGDNEAVYKHGVMPEPVLYKKHHSIAYHRCLEDVTSKPIRVTKEGTYTNLSDIFIKLMTATRRTFLWDRLTY